MLSTRCIRSLGWLTVSTLIWTTVLTVMLFLGAAPHFEGSSVASRNILYSVNDTAVRRRHGDYSATTATTTSKQSIHHDNNRTGLGPHRCVIANGTKLRLITRGTQYGNRARDQSGGNNAENDRVKVILRWTKFYGRSWGVPQGRHIFEDLNCPVKECSITDDKTAVHSAHAIIVHMRDISDPSQLPAWRSKDQRWIFYNLESPHHTETNLTKFNGLFNWTSTYSSESDIPSPYGKYQTFDKYSQFTDKNETNSPRHARSLSQRHATKSRLGAWFVTNCKAKNNRKEYVDALQKNMLIDIYGFCGNFKCHDRESCLDMLKQKYKFYIAFENSNCREYISEKFWYNALEHNILPVVMGASKEDYELAAPPHSYIHVDDFPSAKELARYLKLLHKDTRLYNEYFRWKHQGTASSQINYLPSKSTYWCDLCAALHNDKLPQKVHWDLDKWWSVEEQCWP